MTLTDVSVPAINKTQVYISGALHGDERVGPHVAYYLIEYLASNFGKDPYVTRLLAEREIVITPMTNAVGFARNMREELTSGMRNYDLKTIDINRDFPYNNDEDNCLNSVAGRVVYKLFA